MEQEHFMFCTCRYLNVLIMKSQQTIQLYNMITMKDYTIKQIPYDSTWPIRHEVMYPEFPFDHIKLPMDSEGLHFGLFKKKKLISVVSLFREGNVYQLRKFATLAAVQGSGYGSALLAYLIAYVQEQHAERLWCNARVVAAGFYEKFGMKKTGDVFVDDEIDFVCMELIWPS